MKTTINNKASLIVSRFFSDDVPTDVMLSVMMILFNLGFTVSDNGYKMEYASGSISNYCKHTIHWVRMCEAPDGNNYLTVRFTYESFKECGYEIVDHDDTLNRAMFWDKYLETYFKRQMERINGD